MVDRAEILQFIAERTKASLAVGDRDLSRAFGLSARAACERLEHLWKTQLVEAVTPRPRRARFRRVPGERISDIRFRLAKRGFERLAWLEAKELQEDDLL